MEKELRRLGLPFEPYVSHVDRKANTVDLLYNCPRLTPDGLCSAYEERPQMCRDFAPKSDCLCVLYTGPKTNAR